MTKNEINSVLFNSCVMVLGILIGGIVSNIILDLFGVNIPFIYDMLIGLFFASNLVVLVQSWRC